MNGSIGSMGLKGVGLQNFMGKHHIHQFYGAFAAKGIRSLKSLRSLPMEEILAICASANMPKPAIDRLLEEAGIRKKAQTCPVSKPTKANVKLTEDKGHSGSKYKDKIETKNSSGAEKSKTEASSYYHFASTPAEQAKKFAPKKVTNMETKQFVTAAGASKWNPGNTYEDRDYTKLANEKWENMMRGFRWPQSNIRVDSFPKVNMAFSIVCTRNKIKYIYDMEFTLQWKGKIGDENVKGKLEMSDIMPDEDPEDWEWNVTTDKNNTAHQCAKAIVESSRDVINANLKLLIAQFKSKGG